jgi:hypothetical protein
MVQMLSHEEVTGEERGLVLHSGRSRIRRWPVLIVRLLSRWTNDYKNAHGGHQSSLILLRVQCASSPGSKKPVFGIDGILVMHDLPVIDPFDWY